MFFNDEEIQTLYNIVQICKEHDVVPIFVTVPYLREYTVANSEADPDFYKQFYAWVNTVSEELNVEYFDYSLDERFVDDKSLFYNGDHMNSYGAEKFTDILFDEVIEDRVKQGHRVNTQ